MRPQEIWNRVMMTVARAVVSLVDDSAGRQRMQLQLLKDEFKSDVERMQNYGMTSHPPVGSDAAVVFVAGNREQGIILAVENRQYRLKGLEQGEVALYDDLGSVVHLTREGPLIRSSLPMRVEVPHTDWTGSMSITGDVETTGRLTNNGKDVGSTHTHANNGAGIPNG